MEKKGDVRGEGQTVRGGNRERGERGERGGGGRDEQLNLSNPFAGGD